MMQEFPLAVVRRAALALSLCAAALAPAHAQAPAKAQAKVLATVNGESITNADLAAAEQELGSSLPHQMNEAARHDALMKFLIDERLVTQKAIAAKMDQTPKFKQDLAFYRQRLLMQTYLGKVAKEATTDAAIKATYDKIAKAQKPETEIHALHILVKTKAEAEAVEKRLKSGEDFGKLADKLSKDPGTKGGDLGWFTKERMVPEFADAAFKLKVGEISPPVKTQFGWHVIKVVGKRQTPFPPLEKVKGQIEHFVAQRAQSQEIMKLREGAKIKRFDQSEAKPAAPAAAPKK